MTVRSVTPTTSVAKFISSDILTKARASSSGIVMHLITSPPMVQYAPVAEMYPSMRWLMLSRLFISRIGLPVDMYMPVPRRLASVRASIVDCGIWCVLKLTRVPSTSKNNAFIIFTCFRYGG